MTNRLGLETHITDGFEDCANCGYTVRRGWKVNDDTKFGLICGDCCEELGLKATATVIYDGDRLPTELLAVPTIEEISTKEKEALDRKVYDIKTSERIWGFGDEYFNETLYKTPSGVFFFSRENCSERNTAGENFIHRLTPEEALEWCKRNKVGADVTTKYFQEA